MKLFIYTFFVFFSIKTFATNKFALCAYIDDNDKAKGFYQSFVTENTGNDIYIYYQSDFNLTQNYLVKIELMDSRIDSVYTMIDEIKLNAIDNSKNYTYTSYEFNRPGFYKLTLLDSSNTNVIETTKTRIRFSDNFYTTDSTLDSWYYKNTKMEFCDSILSEIFIGKKQKFEYNPAGTVITTYISHDVGKALHTEKITAKIYDLNAANNLIDTIEVELKPTQRWTSFPITIKDKGKYNVELFSDKAIFIQKKTVEVE